MQRPLHGYLALGDSYTIGEGVSAAARWPDRLVHTLADNGLHLGTPKVIAQTGWSCAELAAALARISHHPSAADADPLAVTGRTPSSRLDVVSATPAPSSGLCAPPQRRLDALATKCGEKCWLTAAPPLGHWQLVSLLIGVNDQYRGYPLAEYGPRFAALLDQAITLADGNPGRVLVLSIPDWGVTPFARAEGRDSAAISAQIDQYNAIAQAEATAHASAFLDITALSRRHGNDISMLAEDGLHPGAAMHALWASAALPVVRAMLAR